MTVEEITAVELNRVQKLVEQAEAGCLSAVVLDARTARALLETYKQHGATGGATEEPESKRLRDRVGELEDAIRTASNTLDGV